MLRFWLYILRVKYNSWDYMGKDHHPYHGQTHSSCDCRQNFTVGGEQWGVVSEDSGSQFCCNGAGSIATWDYSTGGPKAGDRSLPCNRYDQGDMSSNTDDSHGAFASLWCPIDINSCGKYDGEKYGSDWKGHYFDPQKMASPFNVPGLWEGGNFTEEAIQSFDDMNLAPAIYWDFCASSFVRRCANPQTVATFQIC